MTSHIKKGMVKMMEVIFRSLVGFLAVLNIISCIFATIKKEDKYITIFLYSSVFVWVYGLVSMIAMSMC